MTNKDMVGFRMSILSRVVRLDFEDTADLWARLCVEHYASRYLYERGNCNRYLKPAEIKNDERT